MGETTAEMIEETQEMRSQEKTPCSDGRHVVLSFWRPGSNLFIFYWPLIGSIGFRDSEISMHSGTCLM